jgi:hypothetical protein
MEDPVEEKKTGGKRPRPESKTSGISCPEKHSFSTGCLSFLMLLNQYGRKIITWLKEVHIVPENCLSHIRAG